MAKGYDALITAIVNNAKATDDLAAEVEETLAWIEEHKGDDLDPELLELAARLEEKNAKAVEVKDKLDTATKVVVEEDHAKGM